jgi:hypothetical protein
MREMLIAIQGKRCFYNEGHDIASPEVGHVLPWLFVLEDKTWNLVLACRKCNNEKRDRLANIDALKRLCARNEQIASEHIRSNPAFLRLLRNGVRGIYRATSRDCMIKPLDGFPRWK